MLTVEDIADRLRWSQRTAQRFALGWYERQHDPRVPRVTLRRTGRRGRPGYAIDAESFERWLCPSAPFAEAA